MSPHKNLGVDFYANKNTLKIYLSDIYIVSEYYHLINALWILKRK